jgi:hypothetical protein
MAIKHHKNFYSNAFQNIPKFEGGGKNTYIRFPYFFVLYFLTQQELEKNRLGRSVDICVAWMGLKPKSLTKDNLLKRNLIRGSKTVFHLSKRDESICCKGRTTTNTILSKGSSLRM